MIKVLKTDAFLGVAKALEKNDSQTANDILKIISKSIQKDKSKITFSPYIEISDKRDMRIIKKSMSKYGIEIEECSVKQINK